MGITRYSLTRITRPRCVRRQPISHNWSKKPSTKKNSIQFDFKAYQDELEDTLYVLQERILMTRQYIRSISYEYEGHSRDAVEQYFQAINDLYIRIVEYCNRNIRENFPVFKCFLDEIENEYMSIITEGGFTEDEAHEYVYGNNWTEPAAEDEHEDEPAELLALMHL
jgi:hypothetical protein